MSAGTRRVVNVSAVLLILSSTYSVAVAKTHTINLEFGQSAVEPSGVRFSLKATDVHTVPADGVVPVFTAPDGTQLSNGQLIYRDSFAELASLGFGVWTANEKNGDVDTAYQFQVEPFALNDVFTDLPYITSPLGIVVPENFEVHWKYTNGSTPSRTDLGTIKTEKYSLLSSDFISKPGPLYCHDDGSKTLAFRRNL
jgi:hypothetical protein